MKILIVNESDINGGAARAAFRLHQTFLKHKIDSHMLVQSRYGYNPKVVGPDTRWQKAKVKIRTLLDYFPLLFYKNRTKTHFSLSWISNINMVRRINNFEADIVHLHWINSGMLSIKDISRIKAPIIWTMHDNWPFTGGCHIKWDCDLYKDNCGKCAILKSSSIYDVSRLTYRMKKKHFPRVKNFAMIAPSKWLHELAQESSLLGQVDVSVIPNAIDIDRFRPIDKKISRRLWNFPLDKKIILFGAMNATSDINKGFDILVDALNSFGEENVALVVFGSSGSHSPLSDKYDVHYCGNISDDVSLVALYNSADVMVVPSRQENLSCAIMESLACGTPAVAFKVGGNEDLIEHKLNGYLAEPYESSDLAEGIDWVLNRADNIKLAIHARNKIVEYCDSDTVAIQHYNLYEERLSTQET